MRKTPTPFLTRYWKSILAINFFSWLAPILLIGIPIVNLIAKNQVYVNGLLTMLSLGIIYMSILLLLAFKFSKKQLLTVQIDENTCRLTYLNLNKNVELEINKQDLTYLFVVVEKGWSPTYLWFLDNEKVVFKQFEVSGYWGRRELEELEELLKKHTVKKPFGHNL